MEPRMRDRLGRCALAAVLSASIASPVLAAPTGARVANSIYCCTGKDGKNYCADVVPQQCLGREYRELSRTGRTLRVIPPPPTAEELAAKKAAADEAVRQKQAAAEQGRKDTALLATYTKPEEIDTRRDRDIAELERAVGLLREREELIANKRKTLDRDKAFHKEGKLPDNLQRSIDANERDLANVQELISNKTKEIEATRERYTQERARFIELKTKPR